MSRSNPRIENVRSRWRLPLRYDVEAISFFFHFLCSAKARAKLREADVVSVHYPTSSLLFSRYCRWIRRPCVFHTPGHVTGRRFFRYDRSTLYLAISHDNDERIAALTGRRADAVFTPGVRKPAGAPAQVRDTDKPVLLDVLRILRSKGIFRLLEVFRRVHDAMPGARLRVVGRNYEGAALMDTVRRLGLSDCFEHVDEVPYTEVEQYYRDADLFVHPSMADSYGMVLVEAMSCGLPVSASDLPCLAEAAAGCALLLPRGEGEEWPASQYDRWAEKIVTLLRDPARRAAMASGGLEHARTQFWDTKAGEYERLLEEAIRRSGR